MLYCLSNIVLITILTPDHKNEKENSAIGEKQCVVNKYEEKMCADEQGLRERSRKIPDVNYPSPLPSPPFAGAISFHIRLLHIVLHL